LHDLWYSAHKYAKNRVNFDDIEVWKKYKPSRVTKDNWVKFHDFVALEEFKRRS